MIAKVEPSVVAIAREKSDTDETKAVRGRTAAAVVEVNPSWR